MEKFAIIVAGGSGSRMKSELPKQFMLLGGKPVLIRTMEQFSKAYPEMKLVLVLASALREEWKGLCTEYKYLHEHQLVEGGETRYHSVKNGLAVVPTGSVVAIHDAARPLVSVATIRRAVETALVHGNASPYLPANESMRLGTPQENNAIDRSSVMIIQTPQCFKTDLLKKAFELPYQTTFTDDASVFEAAGGKILLVEGNRENIKITNPEDLLVATALLPGMAD